MGFQVMAVPQKLFSFFLHICEEEGIQYIVSKHFSKEI